MSAGGGRRHMELDSEGAGRRQSDDKIRDKKREFFDLGAHFYLTQLNLLTRILGDNVNTQLG